MDHDYTPGDIYTSDDDTSMTESDSDSDFLMALDELADLHSSENDDNSGEEVAFDNEEDTIAEEDRYDPAMDYQGEPDDSSSESDGVSQESLEARIEIPPVAERACEPGAQCDKPPAEGDHRYAANLDETHEAEGQACSICFEKWTNSGDHRISSLNCGHIFGFNCIKKWLSKKDARCPQCNAKAKTADIRVLFTTNLMAIDSAERDRALEELQKEKEARRRAEIEAAQTRLKCQLAEEELARLRKVVQEQSEQLKSSHSSSLNTKSGPTNLFKPNCVVDVCQHGECRVMAYSSAMNLLIISRQQNTNYGITKLNGNFNWHKQKDISCHSKEIRDLAINPTDPRGSILSASLDKSLCINSLSTDSLVQRYVVEAPVWCCEWSKENPYRFFAGLQNGTIHLFDTRQNKQPMLQIKPPNDVCNPTVSMSYVKPQTVLPSQSGGLLVGQMGQIYFLKLNAVDYKASVLPVKGVLSSLTFDESSAKALATFRPSSSSQNKCVQHVLFELSTVNQSSKPSVIDNVCSCNVLQTFDGSAIQPRLTRTALFKHSSTNSSLLACVADESKKALCLWDVEKARYVQQIPLSVLDVCFVGSRSNRQLACLTNKSVHFYKC